MALHPDFPESPHEIADPSVRWLPDNEALRDTGYGRLLPPLVHKEVKTSEVAVPVNFEESYIKVCKLFRILSP